MTKNIPKSKPAKPELKKSKSGSMRSFIEGFLFEVFHMDRRIFITIRTLLLKPGMLTRSRFQNSKKFIPPLKLYLSVNFLFFLIIPLLTTYRFQIFNFNVERLSHGNTFYQSLIEKQIEDKGISPEIYAERFNAHLKYNQPALVFLIVPFFALLVYVVNIKSRCTFTEHVIFSTHFTTFFLTLLIMLIVAYRLLYLIIRLFASSDGPMALILFFLCALIFIFYLAAAQKNSYRDRWLPAFLKSIFMSVGFFMIFAAYIHFLFFFTLLALKLGY